MLIDVIFPINNLNWIVSIASNLSSTLFSTSLYLVLYLSLLPLDGVAPPAGPTLVGDPIELAAMKGKT